STRHWWLLMELNYQQNAPRFRSPRWGIAARVGLIGADRQLAATAICRGRSPSWLCWPIRSPLLGASSKLSVLSRTLRAQHSQWPRATGPFFFASGRRRAVYRSLLRLRREPVTLPRLPRAHSVET